MDGIGRVIRLAPEGPKGNSWWLSVSVPEDLRRYVAEKGSIAIDGISLTVARWHVQSADAVADGSRTKSAEALTKAEGVADFAIIPFTYEQTNVRAMAVGDAVNLECDILAKYMESLLASRTVPAKSPAPKSCTHHNQINRRRLLERVSELDESRCDSPMFSVAARLSGAALLLLLIHSAVVNASNIRKSQAP